MKILRQSLVLVACLAIALTSTGCATGKPHGFLSGYSEMKPGSNFDRLYIAPGTQFSQYQTLVLEVVNKAGSGGDLGQRKTDLLTHRFQQNLENELRLLGVFQEIRTDAGTETSSSLTLRIFVTALDPGSHLLRATVGFGVGAARVEMEGEAIDSSTGTPVFRFVDARAGDDLLSIEGNEDLMTDDLTAMAKNIATVLAAHR